MADGAATLWPMTHGCGLRGIAGRHRDVAMSLIGGDHVVAA